MYLPPDHRLTVTIVVLSHELEDFGMVCCSSPPVTSRTGSHWWQTCLCLCLRTFVTLKASDLILKVLLMIKRDRLLWGRWQVVSAARDCHCNNQHS